MVNQLSIPFQLVNIEETTFTTSSEVLAMDLPVSQNIGISFGVEPDRNIVGVTFTFQLEKNSNVFLKIGVTCYFQIEDKDFQEKYQNDREIVLPCDLAKHLAVITTGTARGVLYANTKNTPFSDYLIGLVNVEKMFVGDIVLKK